jgi:hypothetical protein
MPVYNERSTVEQAMERALETTLPVSPVELIVVERVPRPQRHRTPSTASSIGGPEG